jgi:hypothetical protein
MTILLLLRSDEELLTISEGELLLHHDLTGKIPLILCEAQQGLQQICLNGRVPLTIHEGPDHGTNPKQGARLLKWSKLQLRLRGGEESLRWMILDPQSVTYPIQIAVDIHRQRMGRVLHQQLRHRMQDLELEMPSLIHLQAHHEYHPSQQLFCRRQHLWQFFHV